MPGCHAEMRTLFPAGYGVSIHHRTCGCGVDFGRVRRTAEYVQNGSHDGHQEWSIAEEAGQDEQYVRQSCSGEARACQAGSSRSHENRGKSENRFKCQDLCEES
jgi:hypothetical protein